MQRIVGILIFALLPTVLFSQYPNIRVSSPSSNDPEEVTIAINPTNPLNLAAGANIRYSYRSTDGGFSWIQQTLSSTLGVWGDPVVLFDNDGDLYFAHLSNPQSGNWLDRIVVQKSTDGGVSWNDGAGVGLNPPKDQDKEWLAVDRTNSPFRDNLYMSWTQFDTYGSSNPSDSTLILFSRSTDAGLNWSTPVRVSDTGGNCIDSDETVEGAVPAVGPGGEIYLTWSGPLGIMFDKSTDGGVTFGVDRFAVDQPGGWDFDVPGIYRTNGMPITLCDISGPGSPDYGTIYVVWSDQRNGINDTDVFLVKSTDSGNTWSAPTKINDDPGPAHQFFCWATIDQTTGNLYVVFYDRRNSIANETDVFVARSSDGGETFTNFQVNDNSFTPNAGIFFGDYTNIAAHGGKIYPIWMKLDGIDLSVWTAIIDETVEIDGPDRSVPVGLRLMQNFPNPFNPSTLIEYYVDRPTIVRLTIHNLLGEKVSTLVNRRQEPGWKSERWIPGGLSSGVYFYRLESGNRVLIEKMMLIR